MASARKGNVIRVEASAAYADVRNIHSIKYIGAAASSVNIRSDASASGEVLWTEDATTDVYNPEVCMHDKNGFYVEVTGTAVVYLYLK